MSLWASGIGVARGIAIGRAMKIVSGDLDIPEYALEPFEIEAEIRRYRSALRRARTQLKDVQERIPKGTPGEISAFIESHMLMLEDRAFSEAVEELITERGVNAEAALKSQRDTLIRVFEAMEDPYLRSRRDDVEHVVSQIQRILLKNDKPLGAREASHEGTSIVVADDVTPADIILLHRQGVAGFVTESGGPLSHTAILARSLGIPAIVGLHGARRLLEDGEVLIVDGHAGHLVAAPARITLDFYARRRQRDARYRRMLLRLKDEPARSRDGQTIRLMANIELPSDVAQAQEVGAEGIGLYRTEFLFMNREEPPGEEEQYLAYREVIAAVQGPVTIRTLDLGADKQSEAVRISQATNPALGLRAVRLCLKDRSLFRTQLRALLRAASAGQARIMIPMISNIFELRQCTQLIRDIKAELAQEQREFSDTAQIGAMIEVPGAALAAPWLAQECEFFSIGTNDLIQYTLAIDRVDDEVNYLYDPLHPAVLQLIRRTIEAGQVAGIPVSMCGEMAGDTLHTRLLLGLGLTEFSMHPASVLEVKRIVRDADVAELRRRTDELLACTDPGEARQRIDAIAAL
ncbi:MAG: phosphoenolpyruvate--protein phosphotransferase [Abyssibacter sp.]|uniref:phosphoenolpyruvate--protein phosphotransferase n=1 Tax=Abyssibacter sp. TaxID=2320200 RepID=UPI002EB84FBC|nr:phosphoenolpyruvate--protein phosphotransferase [Pseudomonadota bacterium]